MGRLQIQFVVADAGAPVTIANHCQGRDHLGTTILRVRAPGMETASGRDPDNVPDVASDPQFGRHVMRIRNRNGRDQSMGVGVGGPADHLVGGPLLDHFAEVHDRDAVGDLPGHREVMGDEHERHAVALLQPHEQGEDVGSHRHVEHGDRLVSDEYVGAQHYRGRDRDPLPLAPRQLVGVELGELLRRLEAALLQGLVHSGLQFGTGADQLVDTQWLGHDREDRLTTVERLEGILEHVLHPAAHGAQLAPGQVCRVDIADPDRTRGDGRQVTDRSYQGRLARARLPHDA